MDNLEKLLFKKILFKKNRKKLIQSGILIVLIVSLLILSQIFVSSMSKGIAKNYALLGLGDVQIKSGNDLSQFDFIEEYNDVSNSAGLVYGKNSKNAVVSIKGVDSSYFSKNRNEVLNLEKSTIETTLPTIYISKTLSELLDININDKIALVINSSEKRVIPKLCIVNGIYNSGYKELDQYLVFTSVDTLNKITKETLPTHTEVLLKDNISIENALKKFGQNNINATPWYIIDRSVYNNLLTSEQTLLIIFVVVALLSGFFVSSVASEIVTSNHKEIAIYKLLGMKNKKIVKMYFIAIEIYTICAISIGVILSLIMSAFLPAFLNMLAQNDIKSLEAYLLNFKIIIPYKNILTIIISLLVVSAGTVLLSLKRTKKIEPLQLLVKQ